MAYSARSAASQWHATEVLSFSFLVFLGPGLVRMLQDHQDIAMQARKDTFGPCVRKELAF